MVLFLIASAKPEERVRIRSGSTAKRRESLSAQGYLAARGSLGDVTHRVTGCTAPEWALWKFVFDNLLNSVQAGYLSRRAAELRPTAEVTSATEG
jgi:hypothetical protein